MKKLTKLPPPVGEWEVSPNDTIPYAINEIIEAIQELQDISGSPEKHN